ncbi:M20 family metallopeptidase [Nonomuraea sp. NPDC047897]|uniref:M20 family metallopeptidase n=1 Tax=Nonomuraea sp. NPDC047897 TaxID=3364346 RepID=UPI003723C5DA
MSSAASRYPGPGAHLVTAAECRLDAMLADATRLVGIESPSADHAMVARSAAEVAELVGRRLGVVAEIREVGGVSHVLFTPERPRVLLLGHHDTVWPEGSLADLPCRVVDGVLTGPGCFDMLVGVVQAVHALALLLDAGRPDVLDGVALLITGDEEVGSATSRALVEELGGGVDAVLVLEPAADGGALKTARKGVDGYVVEVTGRSAHAGLEPERGVNAGLEIARLAGQIAALSDPRLETTVTPTTMRAGTTTNTVPDRARLDVDVRAWTAAELDRVHVALKELTPADPRATVSVRSADRRPPLESGHTAGLYGRAVTLARRLGLPDLESTAVGGASDGNFTAALGTPTLDGLGAVGGGAHGRDEHVLVEYVPARTALLAALVADLLGEPPGAHG